jgi:soluble lytic murein transglycosylase-like protein
MGILDGITNFVNNPGSTISSYLNPQYTNPQYQGTPQNPGSDPTRPFDVNPMQQPNTPYDVQNARSATLTKIGADLFAAGMKGTPLNERAQLTADIGNAPQTYQDMLHAGLQNQLIRAQTLNQNWTVNKEQMLLRMLQGSFGGQPGIGQQSNATPNTDTSGITSPINMQSLSPQVQGLITTTSQKTGVDPVQIAALWNNESSFGIHPNASDGGQGFGPMSVHAGALQDVNKAFGTNYSLADVQNNPAIGLEVGANYYKLMQAQFKDPNIATMAYQYGPGNVSAWQKAGSDPTAIPPSTQAYIANIHHFIDTNKPQVNGQGVPSPYQVASTGQNAPVPTANPQATNGVPGTSAPNDTPTQVAGNASTGAYAPTPVQSGNGTQGLNLSPQQMMLMKGLGFNIPDPLIQRTIDQGRFKQLSPQQAQSTLGSAWRPNVNYQIDTVTGKIEQTNAPDVSRVMTPQEVQAAGLPPNFTYQIDTSGKINRVDQPLTNQTLSPQEVQAAGLPPNFTYQRDQTGKITRVEQPITQGALTPQEVQARGLDPSLPWQKDQSGRITLPEGYTSSPAYQSKVGLIKADQDQISETQKEAQNLQTDVVPRLSTLQGIIESGQMSSSQFQEHTQVIRGVLYGLGVLSDNQVKNLSDQDVFNAAGSYLRGAFKSPGISRITNLEFQTFNRAVPNLASTAEGNAVITSMLNNFVNRKIQYAADQRDYYSGIDPSSGQPRLSLQGFNQIEAQKLDKDLPFSVPVNNATDFATMQPGQVVTLPPSAQKASKTYPYHVVTRADIAKAQAMSPNNQNSGE